MIQIAQAHWTTVLFILFTFAVTPFYWFFVLPGKKATIMAWITAVTGAVVLTLVLFNVTGRLGPVGGALIGLMWIIPPIIVWKYRNWFRDLEQRPLVGLQVFRLIGAFFIVEMFRGNIPSSFALPAGIGDIIVGLCALAIFILYKEVPKNALVILIVIGVADFISAFFFGFTSFEGPFQLFAFGFENKTNLFPTGLIPFFLVPYAIVYHMLSYINLR